MKRYLIKCCIDSKSTDMYSSAEIAAFAMIDQLVSLDIPEDEKYVDIIDYELDMFKHITRLTFRDVALTSWRHLITYGLYNY